MRQILGVIAGYAIFVFSSIFLFRFSEVNPHEGASKLFMVLTFVYGTFFSFISGMMTQLIAKTKNLKVNYILFAIMAGFAAFSLFKSNGSSWTQLLAIFVFAPVSILGGYFWIKKKSR
ncbi:hypothetical protein IRZ83_00090 [Flavobacterium sp. JLP]|uniref:hypothetical protein n=1 Tax=unclassified Flavobacterium TaxID=196869 RepID=UPI00188A32A3|nr:MULTISPECIES: hypothetical protein [unclassified Flavobacterium]MBF4490920.1 hypothetical protein [Flavobacterium sp. MR2016-29]MBF4505043.1 hypothetical protein [Flavobacterium sp. JLP]